MDLNVENFNNWLPIRIFAENEQVFVEWLFIGETRFVEPFHDDTLNIILRNPFNQLFRQKTPIEFLGKLYEQKRGIEPNGFIFHVSRCGSTLVSQMFAALEKNIVISEASVIDKIIRADSYFPTVSEEQKITWLRWLFSALSQKRFPNEENFIVKFDSWSVLSLALIEKAFPDVPWIFMYRNPVEVIVSNLRQPGAQMIPGAIAEIFPNLNLFEILQFPIEERFARTIAAFSKTALENTASKNGKLINYNQLPKAVTDEIYRHFNLLFDEEEIALMHQKANFNAKSPQEKFNPDSAAKRTEANENAVKFADELVIPLYEKLENIRLKSR